MIYKRGCHDPSFLLECQEMQNTMSEENLIVDVEAQEVVEEPVVQEEPKMSYKERKDLERARATTLNKMLKDYRRKQKNSLFIAKRLSQ